MKNAVVCLVMLGDLYIPGALVVAKTFKKYNKNILDNTDVVCMVTKDVTEKGRNILIKYFDKIVVVPYIEQNTKMFSKKQNEIYKKWMNVSFTKWNCLMLTEYKKILFLDADLLIMNNIAELFDINTPAAIFYLDSSREMKNYIFKKYKMGEKIKNEDIEYQLENSGNVLDASLVLLEPSVETFKGLKKIIYKNKNFYKPRNSISGPDEVCLTEYYLEHGGWHNIYWKYNITLWKNKLPLNEIKILNFRSTKPWMTDECWDDMKLWWNEAKQIENIYDFIEKKNICRGGSYLHKYLKYKKKYLHLKNIIKKN